jgi:hypothetical protein
VALCDSGILMKDLPMAASVVSFTVIFSFVMFMWCCVKLLLHLYNRLL